MRNSQSALLAAATLGMLGMMQHEQPPAQSIGGGNPRYYGGPMTAKQEKARKAAKLAKQSRKRNRKA